MERVRQDSNSRPKTVSAGTRVNTASKQDGRRQPLPRERERLERSWQSAPPSTHRRREVAPRGAAPRGTTPRRTTNPSTRTSSAKAEARRIMESKKRRAEWYEAFFEAGIIALILFFFFWPTQITGTSMQETFQADDRVIMSRVVVFLKWIHRNDIVICRASEKTNNKDIIKRIIGIPGDRIAISDGKVFVNGNILQESYINNAVTSGDIDIILDKDEYFIMGDNRESSFDSRDIGPIVKRDIIGKVIMRYYPLNKLKFY